MTIASQNTRSSSTPAEPAEGAGALDANRRSTSDASASVGALVDARDDAAWEVILGLRGWRRALLGARFEELAPLVLLVRDEAARARALAELAGDARFVAHPVEVRLEAAAGELSHPRVEVSGGAALDRGCLRALAARARVAGVAAPDPAQDVSAASDGLYVPPERPRAEKRRRLLRSLANPCDGLVDTLLNRPVSRLLTPLLVPTGISPNAVTVLSFLIAALSAGLIASRGYGLALAGALLFQLSAAVDCVDGEIARLTYRFSPFGARLDLALDNVAHLLLFAALGWASVPALGVEGAAWAGAGALVGGLLSFLIVYRLSFPGASGAAPSAGEPNLVRRVLDRVTNRDFSLLVIAAAAAGRLEWLLLVLAVGTNVFWVALGGVALWSGRRERRRRAEASATRGGSPAQGPS